MNEKQKRLIAYFSNLNDPVPPTATEKDVEEGFPEAAAPPVNPPKPTVDSVLEMLSMRRRLDEGAEIEEGIVTAPLGARGLPPGPGPAEPPITDEVMEVARSAAEKALNDQELDLDEQDVLEAIILPGKRPVLDISNGDFSVPPPGWEFLNEHRAAIRQVLPSIGRIDVPELLAAPYAGTGFFVGPGLLMTNRHVARIFVQGVGAGKRYLTFQSDRTASFSPKYEVGAATGGPGDERYEVTEALLVHPHWDVALLRVEATGGKPLPPPLKLASLPPSDFEGGALRHIMVLGYPALDTRNEDPVELNQQMTIFRKIFGRKRLMPGYLTGYKDQKTKWGAMLNATTHDASTLGGASGSGGVDLTTGIVLALHFGGRYLETNFGVPAWELALDNRIVDLGVQFVNPNGAAISKPPEAPPIWIKTWDSLKPLTPAAPQETLEPAGTGTPSIKEIIAPPAATEALSLPVAPDWFERVSNADLVEAMRHDPLRTESLIRETLLPHEADDLIADLTRALQLFETANEEVESFEILRTDRQPIPRPSEEEGIFDFLTGGHRTDPSLPEIIFLHGIMGGHLAASGSLGGRVWLSPLAFAAGHVAERLTLNADGEQDPNSSHTLFPNGHLRLVYEKAARKWRMSGFVVHEFTYDWRKSIANAADRLHLFIESLRLERPAKKFALVGHSMGGLVAALYSARHPESASRVTQSIFLGSPIRGSYAPIEALLGTYPLFPKFALADRLDDLNDFVQMARTLPGLIDMLPDPDLFPDAAILYQRATWPTANAPAQKWLDQSRQLKRTLATSPSLNAARLIVSPGHPTVGDVSVTGERLQPGARNRRGDGTVPTRSAAAGVPGVIVHRATFQHSELPREPEVIQAVEDLLRNGTCRLPLLSQQEIEDQTPVEESVAEILEEATAAGLSQRLRSGVFTQQDVDFLLRADHSTLPGPGRSNPASGGL